MPSGKGFTLLELSGVEKFSAALQGDYKLALSPYCLSRSRSIVQACTDISCYRNDDIIVVYSVHVYLRSTMVERICPPVLRVVPSAASISLIKDKDDKLC